MQLDVRPENYLQLCLNDFTAVCRLKYDTEFDLASVEEKVRRLRVRTPLTYSDLAYFESPEHWWFKRFWVFPPKEEIEPTLKQETFDFWNLPESNEPGTIRRLLHIFKSIELVSIILRFIRPEHYGIFSSPIQHMLDIRHGRNLVETYLAFLDNLREIRKHAGFARVADVDMALWVLHERCFGRYQDVRTLKAYREDNFILQLRANNLVAPLAELSDAKLAKALVEVKPDIAALIACHHFEILIRKLAGNLHLPEAAPHFKLEQILDAIPNYGAVNPVRRGIWQSLREVRNDLIHYGQLPGPRESQLLIEEVIKLESDIGSGY